MNWTRKLFTQNLGLKVLSLALAAALWIAVGSDPITEATFRVPVEFVNVPASLEVLTDQPSVQVWARGPSHSIRQASVGDFTVRVNLARVTGPGEHTFSLDPFSVASPAPVQVVELLPAEIRVTLERTMTKTVPIRPDFSGEPMPGFRMKGFLAAPSEAVVVGPSSHVSAIAEAGTDPVDLTRMDGEKVFTTAVSLSDPLVRFLRPKTVKVTVQLEKAQEAGAGQPASSPR